MGFSGIMEGSAQAPAPQGQRIYLDFRIISRIRMSLDGGNYVKNDGTID